MTRILIAEDEALLAAEIREELQRQWPEARVMITKSGNRFPAPAGEARSDKIMRKRNEL